MQSTRTERVVQPESCDTVRRMCGRKSEMHEEVR